MLFVELKKIKMSLFNDPLRNVTFIFEQMNFKLQAIISIIEV